MTGQVLTQKEYEDLLAFIAVADGALASRWKARVAKKTSKPVLTPDDWDAILGKLIKATRKRSITRKEGEAIVLMMNASIAADQEKAQKGITRIIKIVTHWHKANRLNMTALVTEEELQPAANFLRSGELRLINFKSPGTGIHYTFNDYITVAQLIMNKDILVAKSNTGGISQMAVTGGDYYGSDRVGGTLRLNAATPSRLRMTLVHECTHVIQDYQNVNHLAKFHEADAFVAQEIARISFGYDSSEEWDESSTKAAEMVIAKLATDDNQEWIDAYAELVKNVVSAYNNEGVMSVRAEAGNMSGKERDLYDKLRKQVDAVNIVTDALGKEKIEAILSFLAN